MPDRLLRRVDVEGVAIQVVEPSGSAATAGLGGIHTDSRGRPYLGDVITAVNGRSVSNFDELASAFEQAGVGATVELSILREGEILSVGVDLVALEN